MNIFRLMGDMSKTISLILFWYRLCKHPKHALGISLRTQQLLLLVSLTRYIDVFTIFFGWYNTLMKIFYILNGAVMMAIMTRHPTIQPTYDHARDTWPSGQRIILPCVLLAFATHWWRSHFGLFFSSVELTWTFSICSVRKIPSSCPSKNFHPEKGNP
jgi:ER lumen protein retaining receptor